MSPTWKGTSGCASVNLSTACCDAPMMVIDGQYHENLTPDEVEKILGGLE